MRPGRAAHEQGRLIQWLQLFGDDGAGALPIGQLVVSWRDEHEATAQLEHLEHRPSAPAAAVETLVLTGVHAAADAGARWVERRIEDTDHGVPDLAWEVVDGVARVAATDIP